MLGDYYISMGFVCELTARCTLAVRHQATSGTMSNEVQQDGTSEKSSCGESIGLRIFRALPPLEQSYRGEVIGAS